MVTGALAAGLDPVEAPGLAVPLLSLSPLPQPDTTAVKTRADASKLAESLFDLVNTNLPFILIIYYNCHNCRSYNLANT
ncbi:hypothetical protein D3C75_1108010 [compost metagenome]